MVSKANNGLFRLGDFKSMEMSILSAHPPHYIHGSLEEKYLG